jgi:hypothetical protein
VDHHFARLAAHNGVSDCGQLADDRLVQRH